MARLDHRRVVAWIENAALNETVQEIISHRRLNKPSHGRLATAWHRCVIYLQSQAEFAERHLHKGSMLFVEGQLETRKWFQKDGAGKSETWTAEVAVAKLVILDREYFNDRAVEDEVPTVPDTAFKHDDADGFGAPDAAPTPLSIKRSAARFGDGADAEPDRDGKIDASLPWLG